MKTGIIIFFLFFCGILCAQEKGFATIPPADAILNYLAETSEYSVLFSGKIETPYDRRFENHPYLETAQFVQGDLCYNQVVYQDILMRLDLYRDELIVSFPDKINRVVLEKEKFNYAVINGFTVITSTNETKTGTTYVLQLRAGNYPVTKKYQIKVIEKYSNRGNRQSFHIKELYFVYINDMAYAVNSKNSLLKLFSDRKKELNEYAKLHRLNFRKQYEQSVIALVNHYETLNNAARR